MLLAGPYQVYSSINRADILRIAVGKGGYHLAGLQIPQAPLKCGPSLVDDSRGGTAARRQPTGRMQHGLRGVNLDQREFKAQSTRFTGFPLIDDLETMIGSS